MPIRICSYNLNGVRSAIKKGLIEWMDDQSFDVVCVQETKAHQASVPTLLFDSLGYEHHWHSAQRKGYSGVAIFTRIPPVRVFKGMGIDRYDLEGRVMRMDFDGWTLINGYFPNGGSGPERHQYKMRFLDDLIVWVENLREHCPNLVVVGDYNIAHQDIDINDPVRNKNASGFRAEERDWMSDWFASGFVDAFRSLHPGIVSYTWWRQTQFARQSGKGWRLDYQSVSDPLADRIVSCDHLADAFHSDHCPVVLEIDL